MVMKNNTEEEEADLLVAYLDSEAFQYYFDNSREENAQTEEMKSFQKAQTALLENF